MITAQPSTAGTTPATANTSTAPAPVPALAEDILNGAIAIAAFLGWTRRRLSYEADAERIRITRLPLFRVGATLTARKSSLLRWLAEQETAALMSPASAP